MMPIDMEALLDAVKMVESNGNPRAISPKGAKGAYQFMDATAREYGLFDPFNEEEARNAAHNKFIDLFKRYNGSLDHALAAWNWGDGNLQQKGLGAMPKETSDFITRVKDRYRSGGQTSNMQNIEPVRKPVPGSLSLFPTEEAPSQRHTSLFPEDDALRQNVIAAAAVPPDKAARIYRLGLRTGLPEKLIERNLDELEATAYKQDFDAETFRQNSPIVASWLAESPNKAALVKADYESLSLLEKAWAGFRLIPSTLDQGVEQDELMKLGAKEAFGSITPQERARRLQLKSEMKAKHQELTGWSFFASEAAKVVGQNVSLLHDAMGQGMKYGLPLGATAGGLLGAAGGAPIGGIGAVPGAAGGALAGGLTGMTTYTKAALLEGLYERSVGEAFDELEDAKYEDGTPLDPTVARFASLIVGAPNAALETFSLTKFAKAVGAEKLLSGITSKAVKEVLVRPTVRKALLEFGKRYAGAVATETITEGAQELLQIITRNIATEGPTLALSEQDAKRIGGVMQAAGAATTVLGAGGLGPKVFELRMDMAKAAQNQTLMQQLGDVAKNSSIAKTSPEALNEITEKLAENSSVTNVFLPVETWDTVFQSKAQTAAKEVFGNLDQYEQAKIHGGDMVIPIGAYTEKIAPTNFHEQFLPDIRLAPGDMSLRELQFAEQAMPELEAQIQQEAVINEQKSAPLTQIYDDIYGKLIESGEGQVSAARNASIWKEVYRSRAERLGVDPFQLYSESPLAGVVRGFPGGITPPAILTESVSAPAAGQTRLFRAESPTVKFEDIFDVEKLKEYAPPPGMEGKRYTSDLGVAEYYKHAYGKDAAISYVDVPNEALSKYEVADKEYIVPEKPISQLLSQEGLSEEEQQRQALLFQSAWHGSPHVFDKFSLSKIGTGEGAQAYGYGLYFAESRDIAKYYKEALSGIATEYKPNPKFDATQLWEQARNLFPEDLSKQEAWHALAQKHDWSNETEVREWGKKHAYSEAARNAVDSVVDQIFNAGRLYKVELAPVEDEYLLWDKPLSEQSKKVKAALKNAGVPLRWKILNANGDGLGSGEGATAAKALLDWKKVAGKDAAQGVSAIPADFQTGRVVYENLARQQNDKAASEFLHSLGIRGIKYLDATSRKKGEGDYNYVLFSDEDVTITDILRQQERGFFSRQANIIGLLKGADPSTFLHESGHFWFEQFREDALRSIAPEQLKKDWGILKEWSGATDEVISTEAHEKFARGIEAYVMRGEAPSLSLRSAFAQFSEWLVRIYKSMKMLDVELTPEVIEVMDRMFATDEAIKAAREYNNYDSKMLDISILTDKENEQYQALIEQAKFEATENLRTTAMKELQREALAEWKKAKESAVKDIESELNEQPVWKAVGWLQKGKLPDGKEIPGFEHARLSKDHLVKLGVDLKSLPAFSYQKEGGLHPDAIAEVFGFPDGRAFIQALQGLPSKRKFIEEETARRMSAIYGDMLKDGSLPDQAAVEVQNDAQIALFNFELRVLKRLGARKTLPNPVVLKELARTVISRLTVKQLDPRVYEQAALKAGNESQMAVLTKKFRAGMISAVDAALDAKQRQILNILLYREAVAQKQNINKTINNWENFLFKRDDRLAKTRDMNMVNAARAIVANRGIGAAPGNAMDFMRQMQQYDPTTFDDLQDYVALVTSDNRRWDQLTVSEFGQVQEAVQGLLELSRRSRLAEIEGKKIERRYIVQALNAQTGTLVDKPALKLGYNKAVSNWEKTKSSLMGVRAFGRRAESWADAMDYGNAEKPFTRYVVRPVLNKAVEFRAAKVEYLNKFQELLKPIAPTITNDRIVAPFINYEFTNKAHLLGAMLHRGNESNLQKLLRGYKWGGLTPDGELDTTKWDQFEAWAQQEGILTKADYDFLQSVWDLMDEIKPLAQKAHKEIYGFYFSEISAKSFTTPFGTYRGGYIPARVDPFIVEDAAIRADRQALEGEPAGFMFPSAPSGFTKKRTEAYARQLSLDLGLVSSHINDALRFAYLGPITRDIGRVILDKNFRETLRELDSEVAQIMLAPWLARSANQIVETSMLAGNPGRLISKFMRELRSRTGMQIMTANVTNTLQQFTGIGPAALKVKPRYLAGALFNLIRNPTKITADISGKSKFMAGRTSTQMLEVQKTIDDIILNPSKFEKAQDFAKRHSYFMQVGTQNVVDLITWSGAYNQASEKMNEAQAIAEADAAVRLTQGDFSPENISRLETGPAYMRVFTMFFSYFNMMANTLGTEFVKAHRQGGFGGASRGLYVYTLGFMIPAVISEAIVQAMSGDLTDDDDDDGFLDNLLQLFFMGQVKFASGMVPFAGPLIMAGVNQFDDKWYNDRISASPSISMMETVARTPGDLYDLTKGEEVRTKKIIRDVLTLTGLATGLPLAPLARPLGYLADVEQGYVEPESPADFARGLISGRAPQ